MIAEHQPPTSNPTVTLTPRPSHRGEERALRSESFQIERKVFILSLRENARGRFLRVTEDAGGRRDSIIVPAPGLPEFARHLEEMAKQAGKEEPLESPAES